jgi:hypothetical protein
MLDGLPTAIPDLVKVVQGLIIHPVAVERQGLPPDEATPEQVRFVADMLQHIVDRSSAPLTTAREPSRRLQSNCRTSAVLLVAMLRHQGVPARKRTGFARYINYIHEIAEYRDAGGDMWVLVDPDVPAEVQSTWIAAHGGPLEGSQSFLLRELTCQSCPSPSASAHFRHRGRTSHLRRESGLAGWSALECHPSASSSVDCSVAVRVGITALILPGVPNFTLGGLTPCSDLHVPIRVDRISDVDADVAA